MKKKRLIRHLITGITYVRPLLIIRGFCITVCDVFANCDLIYSCFFLIEQIAVALMYPVVCGFTAYSFAEKSALIPGLLVGALVYFYDLGYVAAMIGALICAGVCIVLKHYFWAANPVAGSCLVFLMPVVAVSLSVIVLCNPHMQNLSIVHTYMRNTMNSLPLWCMVLLGCLLGAVVAVDMGGAIGKVFLTLLPSILLIMDVAWLTAAKVATCMVPSLVVVLGELFKKRKALDSLDKKQFTATLAMALFQISEGALPYAKLSPKSVVPSCMVGSAICGGLIQWWGVTCWIPHGGILLFPFMNKPVHFVMAIIIGAGFGTVILLLLTKVFPPLKTDKNTDELDMQKIKINF